MAGYDDQRFRPSQSLPLKIFATRHSTTMAVRKAIRRAIFAEDTSRATFLCVLRGVTLGDKFERGYRF